MWRDILFAPQAVEDLRRLSARDRATVRDALERHLRHEPNRTSRSRIKRLRGFVKPRFRLRIDEIRVFYDLIESEGTVEVLAIVPKPQAAAWLRDAGEGGGEP